MAAAAAPERGGGSCVLCCGDLEATALGRCDHPVCYRCSTRMRVLCEQRYCAVCREELCQVVFGRKLPTFATIPIHQLQHEKKYDIYFADGKVLALYRQLLQHECPRCPELLPFGLFSDLEQHMRRQHELFCCKLCLQHLKIFTYERKWYSRKDLARHRMQGDPDDTSHRGHPLCKFCDERYLDNDELLKHLRRDHYFCHFCDSDGAQDYYSDYAYLREHFREKHFLCEEGRCGTEQFTHAFRTEIDLKAHRMACHSRSRAEARQNRQIDLQFHYTPRHARREGVVSGEDYEEVDRYNRQCRAGRASGRGAQQSRRGSWRYKRWAPLPAADVPGPHHPEAKAVGGCRARAAQEVGGLSVNKGLLGALSGQPVPLPRGSVAEGLCHWGCGGSALLPPLPLAARKGGWHPLPDLTCLRASVPAIPREEEEREVAAATRASVAAQQQEDKCQGEDREEGSRSKKEEAAQGPEEPRAPRCPARPQGEGPGPKETSTDGSGSQEALPAADPAAGAAPPSALTPPNAKLKDEDFPSLSSSCPAAPGPVGLVRAYPVPARGCGAFQEDDFPALVPSASRPSAASTSIVSAWNGSCRSKKVAQAGTGPQAVGGGGQPTRKAGKGGSKGSRKGGPVPAEEEDGCGGRSAQELRSVPTTITVSSLLALASSQTMAKVGRKKKVGAEKPSAASPPPLPPSRTPKVPDKDEPAPAGQAEGPMAVIVNGHVEGPALARSAPKEPPGLPRPLACPAPQEEFPALSGPCAPRMLPPPGFSTVTLLKGSPPPPPLGLAPPVSKPPPGFSGLLPSPCSTTTKVARLGPAPQAYLVPENFRERNLELIQSIRDFLQSDEARFRKFKSHSGQFRQGTISAAQYYKSCRELLGENFQKIFHELLVLLPDTGKQQELLSAHMDFHGREQPGERRKSAWQQSAQAAGLDCRVCPTCQQVLAHSDVGSHQALHTARDEDFPSLQAIARVIT